MNTVNSVLMVQNKFDSQYDGLAASNVKSNPFFGINRRILGTSKDYFIKSSDVYLDAKVEWTPVRPGILYSTFSYGTRWAPTRIHAIKVNPRQPGIRIFPVLANKAETGHRKTLTALADSQPNVVAAFNCAYFRVQPLEYPGSLVGNFMMNGQLLSASSIPLATLGIDANQQIHIARAKLKGSLRLPFRKSIPITSFNQLPANRNGYFKFNETSNEYMEKRGPWNEVIAFDYHWGHMAPPIEEGMTQVLIENGTVKAVSMTKALPIPPSPGFVIAGPTHALASVREMMRAKVALKLTPRSWSKMQTAISGKPLLLKDGRNVEVWQPEGLPNAPELNKRFAARTAVGLTQDGQLILLSTEGSEYEGLTLPDLSILLKCLGVVNGFNFDGGKSTQMLLQGQRINSRRNEIPLPAALCIAYQGTDLA
jgi:hypothetical protein